jgi:ADP-ribose pyrophosphatase
MSNISNDMITFSSSVNPDDFAKFLKSPLWENWKNKQDHEFDYDSIKLEALKMFGPNPGLAYLTTGVTFNGVRSERVIFLRGGAIGIYLRLRSKQTKKVYVVFVRQPRNAVGNKALREIVAGMLDGATGTLASKSVAAKELKEEAGIEILASDLKLLGTGLPSPGGCDEWIDLYSVYLDADDDFIMSLIGKQTGEYGTDEQIFLEIAEVDEFKTMLLDGRCQDFKAMSAIMMLDTLIARGYDDKPTRDLNPTETTGTEAAELAALETPHPPLPPSFASPVATLPASFASPVAALPGSFASPALARAMSGLGPSASGGGLAPSASGLSNFAPPLPRTSSVVPAPLGRTSSLAPSLTRSMTTGIGGLGATSSVSDALPHLEEDHDDHGDLVKEGLGHFRASENLTQTDKDMILRCPLHAQPRINPGGLWYAPNDMGYSTYSPPCNGCKDGQAESHLWMSGFGHDPHEQSPGGLAPTASGGGLAPTASGGGLAPTASGGLSSSSSV